MYFGLIAPFFYRNGDSGVASKSGVWKTVASNAKARATRPK